MTLEIKLENGFKYEVEQVGYRYTVLCIEPEEEKGHIDKRPTDHFTSVGTSIYKVVTYLTLKGAVKAIHKHADERELAVTGGD